MSFDPRQNYLNTKKSVGYVSLAEADRADYEKLGFKSGLEIHQQLFTAKKLFCRCPAGLYRDGDDYDAELIRHMRPTLSELGEYDGTALMEFKTRKNIIYRIKDESACTYDIDDTPPFPINREALNIAIEVCLLLNTNIVGELHITRKQYLDGSIPTGFQRTAIVGIEGDIPLGSKKIRIIQLSIEEDSCREVSDAGHKRVYTTDRLGMPLIETVTYPDMLTPYEVAEAAQYLRYLARSTGKMRVGIGAAREDVNVSIEGGRRVEIKGVAHIRWIPALTHTEAFRQKALLEIDRIMHERISDLNAWRPRAINVEKIILNFENNVVSQFLPGNYRAMAINLPRFKGILSHFTQPGKMFADELSDRLKVIACIDKPNMTHVETFADAVQFPLLRSESWVKIKAKLEAAEDDAQVLIWGPEADMATACETVEERCRLALDGVPNETRKSFPDGTTIFERVLPGPDRMYPDTDSAPIPIGDDLIDSIRKELPLSVAKRREQLHKWEIPEDTHNFILRNNLTWIIEKIIEELDFPSRAVGTAFGHILKNAQKNASPAIEFNYYTMYGLFKFLHANQLNQEIVRQMIPVLYDHPRMVFDSVLTTIGYRKASRNQIVAFVPDLIKKFSDVGRIQDDSARTDWVMGQLRRIAIGNMPLRELRAEVEKGGNND